MDKEKEKAMKERNNGVSDIAAIKRWKSISPDIRDLITKNVFCRNCDNTEIEKGFLIKKTKSSDILLCGKCKKCGGEVARMVESE